MNRQRPTRENEDRPPAAPRISCEVCRALIPPGSGLVQEVDDMVMHFCGLECYELWRRGKAPEPD